MPPVLLFDLSEIDLDAPLLYEKSEIEQINPQRYEMQQLDGIIWCDTEKHFVLGYKDVTENEFWVRGHIPGRPLMPGVILIECAAQLLSFYVKKIVGIDGFIGFAGIESTKFRAAVAPGQRLYLLGHLFEQKSRKFSARVQGVVEDRQVFETVVSGTRV